MVEQITIWGVKDPNVSSQLILARELGYFKEEGLEVTSRLLPSGTLMPQEILRAKSKPFAWTQTVITTLILREQNLDVKIVAPLADISGTQQVIIREDRSIRSPHDLEGKRIGMAEGAAVYIAIQNMAKDFDVDLSKIQFVDLLPQQQLPAFQNGEIDVMACWEPWTTRAKEAGGTFYFSGTLSNIPGHEGSVNWLTDQSMLMTTSDHIEHDQDILCALIRAMVKATTFSSENLQEAARILTGPLSVEYSESLYILKNNQYAMRMDSGFRLGIYSIRELLHAANVISTLPEEKDIYTPSLLQQVDPTLVDIEQDRRGDVRITRSRDDLYIRQGAYITAQKNTPLTFLLVDDSSIIRQLLKKMISFLDGNVVGEASTGKEAITQYNKVSPDIVMMDLAMPDMTGIEAIKAILQFNPEASIIVLSGSNFPETRQNVFDLGVKMFIPKPFELKKVTTAIQGLLRY